ncbi:MAG: acetamidase/formamidase family protein [Deltaproteobacteria bacterium]|nr:acetamidase/formamidase family protein [Deltaproteobacteria bacterium]
METIKRSNVIYQFGPHSHPVVEVDSGAIVLVETDDCFGSQIKSEKDLVTSVDFSRVNPATGPIGIRGASPGDVLTVEILEIDVGEKGFMVGIPNEGAFGHLIEKPVTKEIAVRNGKFRFSDTLLFPVNPMVGVIGVCPSDRVVPCGEIGDHGGNMDAKVIREGAKIHFLVRVEGAMLALGDVHAGMGDGEAVICGIETTAEVKVKLNLTKSPRIEPQRPIVELDDKFITIGHGSSLDEAASTALNDMAKLMREITDMDYPEIAMLISAVGDLRVCQIVDPQKTARVEMPKSSLGNPDRIVF